MKRTSSITRKVTIEYDHFDLIQALGLPAQASLEIKVPGGGDWSNTRLDVGNKDIPLIAQYHLTEVEEGAEIKIDGNRQRPAPVVTAIRAANQIIADADAYYSSTEFVINVKLVETTVCPTLVVVNGYRYTPEEGK